MWIQDRSRKRRNQHERSERREWKKLNGSCNATTTFRSLSITGKHCARMLPWRSALWRLSKMIPMNAPIFTAKQLTPTTIISKLTDTSTHESRYFSEDSIEDSLTTWVLLYTKKLRIPITSLFHVLRNDSEPELYWWTFNIQYSMFFYFVLSLTFIKVKPQASLKSLRTMKELLCYSFRLDVELIF